MKLCWIEWMVFEQIWGAAESLAWDWNKRLAGRWRNYATGGDFFTPPHSTERELERHLSRNWKEDKILKRKLSRKWRVQLPLSHLPHWVMETQGPRGGGGAGVVRAVKLPPSSLLPHPLFSPLTTPPFPRPTPLPPPQHLPWAKTRHLPRDHHNQSQSTRTWCQYKRKTLMSTTKMSVCYILVKGNFNWCNTS